MRDTHAELRRYADYIRLNATAGREVERVGPFLATFSAHTANPFLSYAIPVDGAVPTDWDVRLLVRAFEARERVPRLEYFPVLAPEVTARLEAAGFALERRIPLMACAPRMLRPVPSPDGVAVGFPASDAEYLGAASAQRDAFRDAYAELEPAGPEDGASLRRLAENGGVVVVAVDEATGEAAGAGVCDSIHDGFGEVAGIGVRPRYRRRGIAAAVTHRLTDAAFDAGASSTFLTPAGPDEQRIYERVGYSPLAEQAHLSLRAGDTTRGR
jgi:ribosomal protein S18 acetylase RimI-like enzyme